jgi:hypothetical protein
VSYFFLNKIHTISTGYNNIDAWSLYVDMIHNLENLFFSTHLQPGSYYLGFSWFLQGNLTLEMFPRLDERTRKVIIYSSQVVFAQG